MSKLRQLAGICLALAGMSLVTTQVAYGDAKYTRKLNDVKVQQTERTKKLEVKPVPAAAPAVTPAAPVAPVPAVTPAPPVVAAAGA